MSAGDASRRAILARRARFVAAALAGIGIAACKEGGPLACLKVAVPHDAGGEDAQPMPCLSPPPLDPDAAPPPPSTTTADAGEDVDEKRSGPTTIDGGAPNLKKDTRPPRPMPCLTPVRR